MSEEVVRMPSDSGVNLFVDARELTIGNVLERIGIVVKYARSKGAPDDAALVLEPNPIYRQTTTEFSGRAFVYPHSARIYWPEPAVVVETEEKGEAE